MYILQLLIAALVLAASCLPKPVPVQDDPTGSSLSVFGPSPAPLHPQDGSQDDWPHNDPVQDDSYCKLNTAPGTKLAEKEKKPLIECYETMLRGMWFENWFLCNNTIRYFESFGVWWNNPDDCYNACKRCFVSAVIGNAANWYCFQTAGFLAQCNVRYMQ